MGGRKAMVWRGLAVGCVLVITTVATLMLLSRDSDGPGGSGVNAATISRAEFDQIQAGMSYDEVVAIVGGPGELTAETTNLAGYHGETYTFDGEGAEEAEAVIQFSNRTAMEKAQVGLEP